MFSRLLKCSLRKHFSEPRKNRTYGRYISVMAAACSRHSAGEAGDINLERSDSVRCGMIMAVARSRGTRAEISAISQQYILSYKKPAPSHLSSIHKNHDVLDLPRGMHRYLCPSPARKHL